MFDYIKEKLAIKLFLFCSFVSIAMVVLGKDAGTIQIAGTDVPLILITTLPIITIFSYCYSSIISPLQNILHEMKALITGKRYRRVFTKRTDEIGITGHFFNEITQNLERISEDLNEHKRLSKELDLAHQIQQNLLPKKAPTIDGLDITAKTKPAEEIGGDSFDFMETEKNLFFYIGDVTGHGVPAGLVMIMVDTLLDTFIDKDMNARDVIINTNRYLEPKLSATMFMTMVLFRFDKLNKKLYYSGAGHEHVVIYRANKGKCDSWPSGGIALGMINDNTKLTIEKEIEYSTDDVLILYSDGVTEGDNASGEQFGLKRLISSVEKHANSQSSSEIFNGISEDYSSFLQGHIQDDDITLMVVKLK